MPSKQETFDIVAEHLLRQGEKSLQSGHCAYRGDHGRRCAAGCLIPDGAATIHIEGMPLIDDDGELTPAGVEIRSLGHDIDLTSDLQALHDEAPVAFWPIRLRAVAIGHELSDAVIDRVQSELAEAGGKDGGDHG